jgi:hypothetical protein
MNPAAGCDEVLMTIEGIRGRKWQSVQYQGDGCPDWNSDDEGMPREVEHDPRGGRHGQLACATPASRCREGLPGH